MHQGERVAHRRREEDPPLPRVQWIHPAVGKRGANRRAVIARDRRGAKAQVELHVLMDVRANREAL